MTAGVLMAIPCTKSLGGGSGGHKHGGDEGRRPGWKFATVSCLHLGRERADVDVDVDPERRSPRYHETCPALERLEESSAAVSKPRCVWLREVGGRVNFNEKGGSLGFVENTARRHSRGGEVKIPRGDTL